MREQAKSLSKAVIWGLGLSLVSNSSMIFIEGLGIHDIDPFDIWNPEIIANLTGRLSVVPILFISVTAIRYASKEPPFITTLNSLVAVAVSIIFSICFSVALNAFYPLQEYPFKDRGAFRDSFVKASYHSCTARYANQNIQPDKVNIFCSCVANGSADTIKKSDITNFTNNDTNSSLANVIRTISDQCRQKQ